MATLTSQARSRAAILGFLAAAAAAQRLDRSSVVAWFEHHGLMIGDRGLRDALQLRLTRQGSSSPRHEDPGECDWVRETLDFDATKLDLDLAIVLFPGSDRTADLLEVLHSTERVIRIYRGYDRDLVVVVGYDGTRERQRLQALLEEHEPSLRWIVVREIDDTPGAATWLSLARRVAEDEGFLAE